MFRMDSWLASEASNGMPINVKIHVSECWHRDALALALEIYRRWGDYGRLGWSSALTRAATLAKAGEGPPSPKPRRERPTAQIIEPPIQAKVVNPACVWERAAPQLWRGLAVPLPRRP
ncbi:hypothetical protein NL676_024396 [Syzygium grande]|nr:hypothetical protein NL676_024396 [Syzygium grande]